MAKDKIHETKRLFGKAFSAFNDALSTPWGLSGSMRYFTPLYDRIGRKIDALLAEQEKANND